jgi:hypothetical protein
VTHTYLVPVHEGKEGTVSIQTGQLISGERIGLAFTSEASLLMTLGPSQHWIRLGPGALQAMLAPLGVTSVRVDPRPIAELGAESLSCEDLASPVGARRPAAAVAG